MTAGPDATVFAVDLGTGGPKVALVSLGGEVLATEHTRVEPRVGADGAATQDPSTWWDAVVAGAAALARAHPDRTAAVVAVAVTGQWGSTVPIDADGEPVGDCLLWMDGRARRLSRAALGGRVSVEGYAPRKALEWIRRSGGAPSLEGNDPFGHRLWFRHEEPDVHRRAAAYVEPLDWLNSRLTGRVAASIPSMLLSWLTDNRRPDHAAYDPLLVRLAGADASQLPPLLPTGSVVGPLLDEVAAATGLPSGIPVLTALPDLHSGALGSGATGLHQPHMSISTSAWISCHTSGKRTSLSTQMATVPSALPGRYILANNHETAGVCLDWLRANVLLADDGLAPEAEVSYALLDRVAAGSPSGSGGVLFTPWLNGERSPVADTALRASFVNMSLSTTRADLVRSVLEGVAHNARWLLDASESFVGTRLEGIRVIGGGAQSDVWCQIHADVLDRPITRVADPLSANVRGAALFAGLSLGLLTEADIVDRVPTDATFVPDPAARAVHDRAHAEFSGLAKAQRGMFRRLNRSRP